MPPLQPRFKTFGSAETTCLMFAAPSDGKVYQPELADSLGNRYVILDDSTSYAIVFPGIPTRQHNSRAALARAT